MFITTFFSSDIPISGDFPYIFPIRIHIVHRIVIAVDIRADAGILVSQRVRGCPSGKVGVVHTCTEVLPWYSVQKELYT